MLQKQIIDDLKQAMKARDEAKTSTLRMVQAALKNKQIELRRELEEEEAVKVVQTMVKQYRDSIADFEKGGRGDLVEKTNSEIAILETYLPAALGEDEVRRAVEEVVRELNPSGPQDFGKVMGVVMKKLGGAADGAVVSRLVKERLVAGNK